MPYLKGGVHHLKGKRGAETPNWKGGVTPERQRVYGTEAWKAAVKLVWQRDDARCRRCDLDYRTVDRKQVRFQVHHIKSFAIRERRLDPGNLVLLCGPCHRFVHSRANTAKEWIA